MELYVLKDHAELATHLARISHEFTNDLALGVTVVAGRKERDPHTPTARVGLDDPGQTDVSRIARRHDRAHSVDSQTPLGRSRRVEEALECVTWGKGHEPP
jgi:hypothetical protein